MRALSIGDVTISDDSAPFIVAEIGNNHGGSKDTAIRLIDAAADAGVLAVKFQLRDNATLYTSTMLNQPYPGRHSYGETYGKHRAALELSLDDLSQCVQWAAKRGVICFATAFDEPSADRIVSLGMPAIKLASGSLTDLTLQRYVSTMGVPLILSTGGGTARDIDRAVQTLTSKTDRLALLHCTAAYPVLSWAELNLRCIDTLRRRYTQLVIGWSGHDSGIAMATVAYTLGARVLEKHFTLDRASKGTDQAFSLEPAGMKKLVRDLQRAHIALGDGDKRVYDSERGPIAKMRRSWIYGRWQIGTDTEREASHATH